MATQALAVIAANAARSATAKIFRRGRHLLLRFAASNAETRIHRARLEAEVHLKYYPLRTKNDDDLPIVP